MSTIETICPNCQRKLRVPSEHAEGSARCPICSTVYIIATAAQKPEQKNPRDQWHLKTPEGQEYGPVTREMLDGWVSEGRVTDDCQLLCEAEGVWKRADDTYPVLRPAPITAPVPLWNSGLAATLDSSLEPIAHPAGTRRYVMNTDRGQIILALGILSWAVGCPIFGIVAWVMGSNDLREMRQGSMDSRGQGMTEAGRLIGMLHAILSLLVMVICIFLLLFWGIFR